MSDTQPAADDGIDEAGDHATTVGAKIKVELESLSASSSSVKKERVPKEKTGAIYWRCEVPGCSYKVETSKYKYQLKHTHIHKHLKNGDITSEKVSSLRVRRGGGAGSSIAAKAKVQGKIRRMGIKREPGAKPKVARKPGAKPKARAKVKVKVKKETVKREPGDSFDKGLSKGDEHYKFQIAFINRVVAPPWSRCFSALGTGFVGVRPTPGGKAEPADEGKAKPADEGEAVDEAAQGGVDTQEESAGGTGESSRATEEHFDVPLDAAIIIFVNAPGFRQQRSGKTIGSYHEVLNKEDKTLNWSGQRSDITNRKFNTILRHVAEGGKTVLATRAAASSRYVELGQVSHISGAQGARFLVNEGDEVIQTEGSTLFHKAILPVCMTNELRQGVPLSVVRHPKGTSEGRWCKACCYIAPRCTIHVEELRPDGINAFEGVQSEAPRAKREVKGEIKGEVKGQVKGQVKTEASEGAPVKRLRGKQSVVKEEPAVWRVKAEPSSSSVVKTVDTAVEQIVIGSDDDDESTIVLKEDEEDDMKNDESTIVLKEDIKKDEEDDIKKDESTIVLKEDIKKDEEDDIKKDESTIVLKDDMKKDEEGGDGYTP